jgi:hypothetical protein
MKKVSFWVICIHICILLWMALWIPVKFADKKPIRVQTVKHIVKSVQKQPTISKNSEQTKKSEVKKTVSATKNNSKPEIKKTVQKSEQKTPSSTKKTKPVISEELIKELEEGIAKIDAKNEKIVRENRLDAPKWIPQFQIETGLFEDANSFGQDLIECLQNTLELPEKGEVKVELTLKKEGSFVELKILHSESKKNKQFLEEELKKIHYPGFKGNLKNEKEHVFVITFCNH